MRSPFLAIYLAFYSVLTTRAYAISPRAIAIFSPASFRALDVSELMATVDSGEILSLRGGATSAPGMFKAASSLAAYIGSSSLRCWITLFISIIIEFCSTTLLKVASDNRDIRKLMISLPLYMVSLLGFAASLAQINVGVAYAVWSALGTAVISGIGVVAFGEKCSLAKVGCILMIVGGVIGLNLIDY